jgi:hypothetical protein
MAIPQQTLIYCSSEDVPYPDQCSQSNTSSSKTSFADSSKSIPCQQKITVTLQARAPEWSEQEVISLLTAVKTYGTNWKVIMDDSSFSKEFHSSRTRMSLKTKWFKMKNVQGFDFGTCDVVEFARKISNGPVRHSQPPKDPSVRKRKISFNAIEATQLQLGSPTSSSWTSSGPEFFGEASKTPSPKKFLDEGSTERESVQEGEPTPSTQFLPEQLPEASNLLETSLRQPPRKKRRNLSFQFVEKIVSHRFVENGELEFMLRWKDSEQSGDSWHFLKEMAGSMGQLLAFYFNDAEGISLPEICRVSTTVQSTTRKL